MSFATSGRYVALVDVQESWTSTTTSNNRDEVAAPFTQLWQPGSGWKRCMRLQIKRLGICTMCITAPSTALTVNLTAVAAEVLQFMLSASVYLNLQGDFSAPNKLRFALVYVPKCSALLRTSTSSATSCFYQTISSITEVWSVSRRRRSHNHSSFWRSRLSHRGRVPEQKVRRRQSLSSAMHACNTSFSCLQFKARLLSFFFMFLQ